MQTQFTSATQNFSQITTHLLPVADVQTDPNSCRQQCQLSHQRSDNSAVGMLSPTHNITNLKAQTQPELRRFQSIPYILAYKLQQNLPQNLDLKVGGATYTRVIK